MDSMVRVWALPDLQTQHDTVPPGDDTAKEWEGTTACGISGTLRWVHGETVDRASTCRACADIVGTTPPLEGDHPGPV